MLPAITGTVVTAVAQAMTSVADRIASKLQESFNQQMLLLRYEQDRLEQYTRRETIRITGLEEEAGEDWLKLKDKVVDLTKEIGCDIQHGDISICHRNGQETHQSNGTKRPRQVLVKFVSREKKVAVMKNKKNLKDKKKNVYVNEDLTGPRAKMLKCIREKKCTQSLYTKDGRIICKLKSAKPEERPVTIETPHDLIKLGFDEDEIKNFQQPYIKAIQGNDLLAK